jgi:tetratricopeptide (TPR) repeat protein
MRKGKITSLATRGLSSQWKSFLVVLAGAAALAFAAPQQKQKQAELLLIEAINKELVEGDLQQAIELYKQVISKFSSERPVVARALLRLGEGYEKLGKPEAREAFERVLRDYAEQAEQLGVARTRLAALRRSDRLAHRGPCRI